MSTEKINSLMVVPGHGGTFWTVQTAAGRIVAVAYTETDADAIREALGQVRMGAAPAGEVVALREQQATRVMPLIGPFLDAFDRAHPDDTIHESGIRPHVAAINAAMEGDVALISPAPAAQGVADALAVVNEAANDARHAREYKKANALVKARITLWKAATAQQPVECADCMKILRERDHAEGIIDKLCDAVLGADRNEWSSAYFFENAVEEVEDRIAELTAPQPVAVDGELLNDLDEWLQGCPDPDNVWPRWLVKKTSRLLWRCRAALRSGSQGEG